MGKKVTLELKFVLHQTKHKLLLKQPEQRTFLEKKVAEFKLTAVIEKRFNFKPDQINLFAERVDNRALCATAQAESLRYKLLGGLAVRRACYGVMRFIMDSAAKGCEIIVSGKIRAQRAKAMKFRDGYMIKTGQPVKEYVDVAIRHVLIRQGVLGIKVSIMLPHDPTGKVPGLPNKPQADVVTIIEPKEEIDRPVTVAKKEAPVEEAAE